MKGEHGRRGGGPVKDRKNENWEEEGKMPSAVDRKEYKTISDLTAFKCF